MKCTRETVYLVVSVWRGDCGHADNGQLQKKIITRGNCMNVVFVTIKICLFVCNFILLDIVFDTVVQKKRPKAKQLLINTLLSS